MSLRGLHDESVVHFPILPLSRECNIIAIMAPAKKRNVSSVKTTEQSAKKPKIDINTKVERILESRKHANDIFDVLEVLEVRKWSTKSC